MKNKEKVIAITLAGLIAFLYISGIPAVFFVKVDWLDVDPTCIALLFNIAITLLIGLGIKQLCIPKVSLGFRKAGFIVGIKKYWISCILAFLIPMLAFFFGLMPFNYTPTVWKVLIEGVIYYIGVGLIEELFCRGLLQNSIQNMASRRKNPELIAVLSAAFIFGAGHIFGMIGMPLLLIACKLIWAVGLGIYLGAVYVKTKNLWLVCFFHFVIDLCGLPFCFSTQKAYPTGSAIIILLAFVLLGMYGVMLLRKPAEKCR